MKRLMNFIIRSLLDCLKSHIENGKQLKGLIISHKAKSKHYWKSNLLRECGNREQIDQIPVLLDVKDLLLQVKALDKDGHYTRVEKGMLEQCNYNDVYLQNDTDKAEEIICRVHESYDNYLKGIRRVAVSYSTVSGEVT